MVSSPLRPHHKVHRERKIKKCSATSAANKTGRWERWEKRAFLEGLRRYGQGKWKKISRLIPTRTPIQVKTHAQVILKKMALGTQVLQYLDSSDDSSSRSAGMDDVDGVEENWPRIVPSKALHMTPNERDFDAAYILADLHLLCV